MFEVVGPTSPQWIPAAAFLMHRVRLSPPFATPVAVERQRALTLSGLAGKEKLTIPG
jgi:hypothetical protein